MLKVYIAGPYSADNTISVLKNIGRGKDAATMIFEAGYAPFCPWHNESFTQQLWYREIPVQQYMDYCIEWLKVSDILFVLPKWKTSPGTRKEISIAETLSIPIIFESFRHLFNKYPPDKEIKIW